MHYMIRFKSSNFDVTQEDENPINPIYGQSLLAWAREKLAGELELEEPDAEDWGWYTYTSFNGRSYMLGASAELDEEKSYEWIFQVDKHRSFKEKLFGKEKMSASDECLLFFKSLFEKEPGFEGVEVE